MAHIIVIILDLVMEQLRNAGPKTNFHQKLVYVKTSLTFKILSTFLGGAIASIAPPINPPLVAL